MIMKHTFFSVSACEESQQDLRLHEIGAIYLLEWKPTHSLDVLFIAQLALLFAELMHAVSFVNLSFIVQLTLCQFYNAVC